jgi:hypothetical protein
MGPKPRLIGVNSCRWRAPTSTLTGLEVRRREGWRQHVDQIGGGDAKELFSHKDRFSSMHKRERNKRRDHCHPQEIFLPPPPETLCGEVLRAGAAVPNARGAIAIVLLNWAGLLRATGGLPARDLVGDEAGLHGWTGRRVGRRPLGYGGSRKSDRPGFQKMQVVVQKKARSNRLGLCYVSNRGPMGSGCCKSAPPEYMRSGYEKMRPVSQKVGIRCPFPKFLGWPLVGAHALLFSSLRTGL